MHHEHWIKHCLSLAERGRGRVGINPMVGAVLVSNDAIVGEGWHQGFGMPHAERLLFDSLDEEIVSSFDGAQDDTTLYLNLEPCCHQGKTPPCTSLIIEKGIKRVIYGMIDPDERVRGKGIAALRQAGVAVIGPVLPELCQRFNRGYASLQTNRRPWVTLKRAQTRDGRIASEDGSPLSITSQEQDVWSHTWLRARHDAVLVGVQTIIKDDPTLDARHALNKRFVHNHQYINILMSRAVHPLRIVLDPRLKIPLSAKVVSDDRASSTIVVSGVGNGDPKLRDALQKCGVGLLEIPMEGECFDWEELWKRLTVSSFHSASSRRRPFGHELRAEWALDAEASSWPRGKFQVSGLERNVHGIASVLVEGGARTWESFKKVGMVDEEVVLVGS